MTTVLSLICGGAVLVGATTHAGLTRPAGSDTKVADGSGALRPPGLRPQPVATPPATPDRTAAGQADDLLSRRLLDATRSNSEREKILADAAVVDAGPLIAAMVTDLEPGTAEEYVRIPWIWRAAVAAGRRNQIAEMKSVLAVSLPKIGEPLRDWQAVVLGGGVVHGISQSGLWPAERLKEILRDEKQLGARWKRVPDLAVVMAADEGVKPGTRYDALRILGVESWKARGATLTKYLGPGVHAEVQQGAIAAVSDMRARETGPILIANLNNFSARNRSAALNALLRDDSRMSALLDAVAARRIAPTDLGEAQVQKLKAAENEKLRARAAELLK